MKHLLRSKLARLLTLIAIVFAFTGTGFGIWVFKDVNMASKDATAGIQVEAAMVVNDLKAEFVSMRLVLDDTRKDMSGMSIKLTTSVDYTEGYNDTTGDTLNVYLLYDVSCYITPIDANEDYLGKYLTLSKVDLKHEGAETDSVQVASDPDNTITIDGVEYYNPIYTIQRKLSYTRGSDGKFSISDDNTMIATLFPYFSYTKFVTNNEEYNAMKKSINNSRFNFTFAVTKASKTDLSAAN